jgi:hypothetical protein
MDRTNSSSAMIHLANGRMLRLQKGGGTRLQVVAGCVWLMEDKDRGDYVIRSGGSLVLNGLGMARVYAFADTMLRLTASGSAELPEGLTEAPARISASAA